MSSLVNLIVFADITTTEAEFIAYRNGTRTEIEEKLPLLNNR
jgi:hypothetical protein